VWSDSVTQKHFSRNPVTFPFPLVGHLRKNLGNELCQDSCGKLVKVYVAYATERRSAVGEFKT
jgi:hypothetical protein